VRISVAQFAMMVALYKMTCWSPSRIPGSWGCLEVPFQLTGIGIERDDGVGIEIVGRAA